MIEGTHLLVAAGRRPNVARPQPRGRRHQVRQARHHRRATACAPRTRRVFAIGDVTGGLQFTHVANYHAGIVIRRALFRLPAKVNRQASCRG